MLTLDKIVNGEIVTKEQYIDAYGPYEELADAMRQTADMFPINAKNPKLSALHFLGVYLMHKGSIEYGSCGRGIAVRGNLKSGLRRRFLNELKIKCAKTGRWRYFTKGKTYAPLLYCMGFPINYKGKNCPKLLPEYYSRAVRSYKSLSEEGKKLIEPLIVDTTRIISNNAEGDGGFIRIDLLDQYNKNKQRDHAFTVLRSYQIAYPDFDISERSLSKNYKRISFKFDKRYLRATAPVHVRLKIKQML